MHSDGLSTRQSHCSGKKSTAQRGREGGRLSPLLHPYSLFCLLCFTHYLQSVSSQSPSVSYPSWAREEWTFTNRHWRISTIMSPLWGRSFSLSPAMLPSSSLSPGRSPFRGKPLEESLFHREAEAEETAGPRSRVSGYFEKGCSVHGSHITFLFLWVHLLRFIFFPLVS